MDHPCRALVDSGAEGSFIDASLARELRIPVVDCPRPITVQALTGQVMPTVTQWTVPFKIITAGNHTEEIRLYLIESPLVPVVLGHPWLSRHNPHIDWQLNSVRAWSSFCHASCLLSACSPVVCSVFQKESMDLSNVPEEYLDLKEVFSTSQAASLPPHRPYDCAIELLPGTSPP
ncbi:MAG: retropepsin-like aspartic protease, partial [Plesiomonas sp.]